MTEETSTRAFLLRLPAALFLKIAARAETNRRSITQEMLIALERYVEAEERKER